MKPYLRKWVLPRILGHLDDTGMCVDLTSVYCFEQENRDYSEESNPGAQALNPGHIGPQYSKNVKGGEEDESKLPGWLFLLRIEKPLLTILLLELLIKIYVVDILIPLRERN